MRGDPVRAWDTDDPTLVRLSGDTYSMRERIKEKGGTWDGHHWTVGAVHLAALGIPRMVRVLSSCSSTPGAGHEQFDSVPEEDAVVGKTYAGHCGWCDGRCNMHVVRLIEKDE